MPELPEVESIKLQLQKFVVGHRILDVDIRWPRIFEGDPKKVIGSKILGIRRFGKVLVVDLDNDYSLVIQIKLTGQLIYKGPLLKAESISPKVKGGLGGKHTHVIFKLDAPPSHKAAEGQAALLYYNDVRKFGKIKVVQSAKIKEQGEFIGKLGLEFLKDLKLGDFEKIVKASNRPIKILLMDQSKMAGVGNIYANDALFLAGIKPNRKSSSLSLREQKKLFESIEKVLKEGIKRGGASELAYVTPDGKEGSYQDFTLVYGREGELCKNKCGSVIKKIKLGGRGTYFCPVCQK